MRRLGAALLALLLAIAAPVWARAQPALNANGWTLILVPSFETPENSQTTHNLSITGLNHSLRFSQLLTLITSGLQGQIRQVQAFATAADDLAPLQSIEPFAVIQNLSVNVVTVATGGASTYGSAAYWVQQTLANAPVGIYVIAAPRGTVEDLVHTLTGSTVHLQPPGHYAVVAGPADHLTATAYDDGIVGDPAYPAIPPLPHAACTQPSVTITAKAPPGLKPYQSRTVYFVRHVEAHPTGNFENGNYVCQGQWRALGATRTLLHLMNDRKPDAIISSNPSNLIACTGGCSYIRPLLTVTPFAIQHDLPVTQAPFQWTDATDLAFWLFDKASPYAKDPKDGGLILVGWEHDHIVTAVTDVFQDLYQNPQAAKQLPPWSFTDYDTVWKLSTDDAGTITFTNTCEGIASAKLPAICPAFFLQ